MKHQATSAFWTCYAKLPRQVRSLADKNYELLKADPYHPSLHFKKVGTYWTLRVGSHYRAIANVDGDNMVWFWIGSHADYDKLVG